MSKPKHTPGPWHKSEDKNGNVRVGSANHSIALLNNPLLFQFVEADARLIAAAPEMLEALTALFAASPHDMSDMLEAFRARQKHNPAVRANDLNAKFADALLLAQAAIAKATGGAE